ncbi:hypothetical protein [Paraburkholderia sp. GAS334]|uniref:hypothetical protein n=1 Tax=Paraburkholderia sp. GAS334 TaxID=3035131 RepID=UPI003D1A4456
MEAIVVFVLGVAAVGTRADQPFECVVSRSLHGRRAHYFFDKTSEFQLARDTIERIARERVAGATE